MGRKYIAYTKGLTTICCSFKKIKEVLGFYLPRDMLCTSHGVIWRDNPAQIIEKNLEWIDSYKEGQITI
jgi:anaerobic nitric oxide reductase flavorubredoxin